MKKNIIYIIIFIISFMICVNLFINLTRVNAMAGPHVIAGEAYYNFNNLYPAINATVDAYNDKTDEWIYNVDTVSNSGKWNFNVGSPVPDWSNGDQITIYIHQDNPGEYYNWNGTITTTINIEYIPQIVPNCYLTFTSDSKNDNDDKNNSNENDTAQPSDTESPAFEIIFIILSLWIVLFFFKRRK